MHTHFVCLVSRFVTFPLVLLCYELSNTHSYTPCLSTQHASSSNINLLKVRRHIIYSLKQHPGYFICLLGLYEIPIYILFYRIKTLPQPEMTSQFVIEIKSMKLRVHTVDEYVPMR